MKLNMKTTVAFLMGLTIAQRTNAAGAVLGITVKDDVITIDDNSTVHTFSPKQGEEFQAVLKTNGIEMPEDCFKVPFYKKVTLIEAIGGVTIATIVGVTAYKLFGPEGVITAANAAAGAATSAVEAAGEVVASV